MSGHLHFGHCEQAEVAEFCIHCCVSPHSSSSAELLQNCIITQVWDLLTPALGTWWFSGCGLCP